MTNMKTIAITIDDRTLKAIDVLAAGSRGRRSGAKARKSRSAVIRQALQEFVARQERRAREEAERVVLARARAKLARQARALVREQAVL
jgi:metal-responsive CopG/Arc/MetJ family transcriptional regulator